MSATAGQAMLDSDGKQILRADGTDQLSDGAGDACCCAGHACYQLWTAYWDCDTLAWVIEQAGKFCLPDTTDESWMGSGCTGWTKYTAMSHACTSDGDCSAFADTATPDPPFPGEPPDCYCPCLAVCGCRNIGRTAVVSFAGVSVDFPCTNCGTFWIRGGVDTLGTYTLDKGTGCAFDADITGRFFEIAPVVSDACPPDEDFFTDPIGASVSLGFDVVTGKWSVLVISEDFQLFVGDVDQGDCTGPLVIDNDLVAFDPCGTADPQTFAVAIGGTATVVFKPCTPT